MALLQPFGSFTYQNLADLSWTSSVMQDQKSPTNKTKHRSKGTLSFPTTIVKNHSSISKISVHLPLELYLIWWLYSIGQTNGVKALDSERGKKSGRGAVRGLVSLVMQQLYRTHLQVSNISNYSAAGWHKDYVSKQTPLELFLDTSKLEVSSRYPTLPLLNHYQGFRIERDRSFVLLLAYTN